MATLKRATITNTILREKGGEAWRRLLESLSQFSCRNDLGSTHAMKTIAIILFVLISTHAHAFEQCSMADKYDKKIFYWLFCDFKKIRDEQSIADAQLETETNPTVIIYAKTKKIEIAVGLKWRNDLAELINTQKISEPEARNLYAKFLEEEARQHQENMKLISDYLDERQANHREQQQAIMDTLSTLHRKSSQGNPDVLCTKDSDRYGRDAIRCSPQ